MAALTPQTEGSKLDQSFVADRAIFWERFTGFVKYGTIGIIVLLIGLLVFVA
jgi:hypothetical protein